MTAIGVTGHRSFREVKLITRKVDAALKHIWETYPAPFVVYSALAEGADRLVVQRTFDQLGASLVAILPLQQAEYQSDFTESDSHIEFEELLRLASKVVELPPAPNRDRAYEAAGRYILEHVDLLIAVWDGKPARGQGGTGQIVTEARKSHIPVVWIRTTR